MPLRFKDLGMFVCRFYKGGSWVYLVIDDRIPVHAASVGGQRPNKPSSREPASGPLWKHSA